MLGRLTDTGGTGSGGGGVIPGVGGTLGGGGVGGSSCELPEPARHYTFDGAGTEIIDVAGGPAGRVRGGAVLAETGELELDGEDDFVEFDEAPWGDGDRVSIALWVRSRGISGYQRLFDFGSGSAGVDPPLDASSVGRSYLALTPNTGFFPSGLAILFSDAGSGGEIAAVSDVKLGDEVEFLVVSVDGGTLRLHRGGELVTRVPHSIRLSTLGAENNWLGRSQYSQDPFAEVTYLDLQIHREALDDCEVRALFQRGPE